MDKFMNAKSPREQLQAIYENVKPMLNLWIKKELYTILYETDDEMFYIPELLKWKKKKDDMKKATTKKSVNTD